MNLTVGNILLKYIAPKGRILDAGCGNFEYTNFLEKYAPNITCVDIENINPVEAKKHNFFLASIEALPFKNSSFDFVYCLSVIQLVKNKSKVIDEFHRILKPGGKLVFTVPTSCSIFKLLRELEILCGVYATPSFNVKHYQYYTKRSIRNLVSGKFKIIDVLGYTYNFVPRLYSFILALMMPILKFTKLFYLIKYMKNKLMKKHNESNTSTKTNTNTYIQKQTMFDVWGNKIKCLNNLSYHYVVIVEKI